MPPRAPKAAAGGGKRCSAQTALQQFRVIFSSVKQHFHRMQKQTGVNGSQLWALAVVAGRPGMRVSELAAAMSVHQSTASNLLENLVRQDLVERRRGSPDLRVTCLFPSERGLELLATVPVPVRNVLPEALEKMNGVDLAELVRLLGEVLALIKGNRAAHESGTTRGIPATHGHKPKNEAPLGPRKAAAVSTRP